MFQCIFFSNKTLRLFLIFAAVLYSPFAYSDWGWWNETHNWDGHTHWSKYLIMSPTHFGPNALPVPLIHNGMIYETGEFHSISHRHFHPGDRTIDLYNSLYFPLYSPRAGLRLSMISYEFFDVDPETRDYRRSRKFENQGSGIGDLYVSTYIQLVQQHAFLPDMLVSLNLRTASGSNFYAARFTDTPGYYFDLSLGKDFFFHKDAALPRLRPYTLLGFYVWQTNQASGFQNDAFLYGVGIDFEPIKEFVITQALGGYIGYHDNGDRPMVYRLELKYQRSRFDYTLKYQYGIFDFPYQSIGIGLIWKFSV